MHTTHHTTTAADLRAALARARVPAYVVAARVRLHPVHLSRLMHGRVPLRPGMAERILAAIAAGEGEDADARA